MGLKFFKRGTYNSVSSALSLIRQEFEALWAKIGDIRPGEEGALTEQQSYIPDIGSPASFGYTGMFYIHAESNAEDTQITIQVMYGTEFDKGDGSIAIVNGEVFRFNAWSTTLGNFTEKYVYLKYTPEGGENTNAGESASKAKVEIVVGDEVSSDTEDNAFYYLGRITADDKEVVIEQWHVTNIAIFYHGIPCVNILEVPSE